MKRYKKLLAVLLCLTTLLVAVPVDVSIAAEPVTVDFDTSAADEKTPESEKDDSEGVEDSIGKSVEETETPDQRKDDIEEDDLGEEYPEVETGESIEEEDAEDEDPNLLDKLIDDVKDLFEDDSVSTAEQLQEYLSESVDPGRATVTKMEKANMIWIKQTLADGTLLGEDQTVDALFSEENKGEAFITMLDDVQYLYNVDDDSAYYVAVIDTMRNDGDTEVAEVTFAHNNVHGEVIGDAIYDYDTGICYIPKAVCKNADGVEKLLEVQAQVLQVADTDMPETSVDVIINNKNVSGDVEEDTVVTADATEVATTVAIANDEEARREIGADDITVKVNGSDEPLESCIYDARSGELIIPVAPMNLDTVEIELKKENPIVALFSPMKVHAESADTMPMTSGAWSVDGTAKEGDIFQGRIIASYTSDPSPGNVVYGAAGANSSDAVLTAMANSIYGGGSLDMSNLERLTGLSGEVYPWHVNAWGSSFTAGDGTTYTGPFTVYALKCGHISNPFNGWSDVGATGSKMADVVFHVYKVDETAGWMIIGILTPASHTQTGVGLFKVPINGSGGGGEEPEQNDPISLVLQKKDLYTGEVPQGDGFLEGAQYTIKYYKGEDSSPMYTWLFQTDSTGIVFMDESHKIGGDSLPMGGGTGGVVLPVGKLTIQEKAAPTGYRLDPTVYTVDIKKVNGVVRATNLPTEENAIKEHPIMGGVKIQKYDSEWKTANPQGDATLEGARFAIINHSINPVYVEGTLYSPGETVKVITTDASGLAATGGDVLPYGSYEIKEITPPTGYLNEGVITQNFEIRQDGVVVDMTALNRGIQNDVIRGGVKVQKRDLETKDDSPLGGANFNNITMQIVNVSLHAVRVEGNDYNPGYVVKTFQTDEHGTWVSSNDLLPYGSYILQEVTVPAETGYLKKGILSRNFRIRQDGVLVDLGVDSPDTAIQDQVMRGDIEIRKIDSTSQRKMANIQFRITSLTNGESHVFMTDDNGEYRSSVEWIPHSQNTNGGTNGRKTLGDGLWFGTTQHGVTAPVDNSLRALPYDTYRIEELPCEANKNKVLYDDVFTVYTDQQVIYLNSIENLDKPGLESQASGNIPDTSLGQYLVAEDDAVITDVVNYTNVTMEYLNQSGMTEKYTYVLEGKLMDKDTGEPLLVYGKEVTAKKTFKCEAASGSVRQEFCFDASELGGKTVVVFENMYAIRYVNGEEERILVGSHEDLDDENQTVYIPGCGTQAVSDDTNDHLAKAGEQVHLTDTVSYENLAVGYKYTVTGYLIDKKTGKHIKDADGNNVTGFTTFRPTEKNGEVKVHFDFELPQGYEDHTFVVFERIYHKNALYAIHADIDDEGQTIYVPKIGTTAIDDATKDHIGVVAEKTTITDTVEYFNVIVGKTYTISGKLIEKDSELVLKDKDGKPVTAETTFVAKDPKGKVDLVFTLDSTLIAGKTVVAFEDMTYGEVSIATHADIEDEDQSVYYPEIGTSAIDSKTKSHTGVVGDKAVIIDTVTYKNLIPRKEYVLKGVLMNKSTNQPLIVEGKEVTTELRFKPKKSEGTLDLKYHFNASTIAGTSVVVFEDLYHNDVLVAAHADIDDEDQTVSFPRIGTTATINGEKEALIADSITITDKVSYENLTPGTEYTLEGFLMDKETGKPLRVHGTTVKGMTTFIPENVSGEEDITFVFDAENLGNKEIVVFEELYLGKKVIVAHKDINDEGQTVKLISPPPKTPPKTGDDSKRYILGIIGGVAFVLGAYVLIRKKKKK